MCIWNDESIGC
uniref:Uncharacterized protein n=1 Tax=Anopheles quadriannulatus TaxID=34691 RepID=A0A182XR49_ANOQN